MADLRSSIKSLKFGEKRTYLYLSAMPRRAPHSRPSLDDIKRLSSCISIFSDASLVNSTYQRAASYSVADSPSRGCFSANAQTHAHVGLCFFTDREDSEHLGLEKTVRPDALPVSLQQPAERVHPNDARQSRLYLVWPLLRCRLNWRNELSGVYERVRLGKEESAAACIVWVAMTAVTCISMRDMLCYENSNGVMLKPDCTVMLSMSDGRIGVVVISTMGIINIRRGEKKKTKKHNPPPPPSYPKKPGPEEGSATQKVDSERHLQAPVHLSLCELSVLPPGVDERPHLPVRLPNSFPSLDSPFSPVGRTQIVWWFAPRCATDHGREDEIRLDGRRETHLLATRMTCDDVVLNKRQSRGVGGFLCLARERESVQKGREDEDPRVHEIRPGLGDVGIETPTVDDEDEDDGRRAQGGT
ncbi:hypothetical protein GALMADRAFT_210561 [Galerina marginata CBS 339.88]|uniref:Uncharacterized protein n=1 Tax=Galerina marginata (strain CBS 339.88) TaxID=685588 RepID=A0A067T0B9_GALM3|nr:hypothetical protein GALMADRAFT_210561 [Galerina marginata CBS 339.88]